MFVINQTYSDLEKKLKIFMDNRGEEQYKYAFYVYHNNDLILKKMYEYSNRFEFDTKDLKGRVRVVAFTKNIKNFEVNNYELDPILLKRDQTDLKDIDTNKNFDLDILLKDNSIPAYFVKKFESKRLVVFLNSALTLDAQKKFYPYYNRVSFHQRLDCNCLYLYDISLNMVDNYTIGWYRGVENNKLHNIYLDIIRTIAKKLGIMSQDIVFYGSGGGGFAALKFAQDMAGSTAIAINPQINILDYMDKNAVKKFTDVFDVEVAKQDIKIQPNDFLRKSKFIYVQNKQDIDHFEKHFKPFWSKFSYSDSGYDRSGRNYALVYDHESGYAGESPEIFKEIMKFVKINILE